MCKYQGTGGGRGTTNTRASVLSVEEALEQQYKVSVPVDVKRGSSLWE